MSLGSPKAGILGVAGAGVVAAGPLPVGLAITSAADPAKNNLAGYGIARDASGDIYVPSYYQDGVDANYNAGVTKYDGITMAILWSKHIQSADANSTIVIGNSIAVADGIIVASYHVLAATSKYTIAITKLDFSGTLVWTQHIAVPALAASNSRVVELSTGDLVVAFNGPGNLNAVRLTALGAEVWKKHYTIDFTPTDIAVDSSNNVYVSGQATDTVQYAGAVKISSAGTLLANPRFNTSTPYNAYAYSVSLDSSNNVFLAGRFTNSATVADNDGYVMKLNSSLALQWVRKLKAAPTDQYDHMHAEVGPDDMVYAVGYIRDADGINDGLIAKYDTSGVLQWKRSLVTGRAIGARPAMLIDATNITALMYGRDANSIYDTWTFTVPIDGTGLGTYNDAVYADATNVTDSAYAGVTAYGNFGLTEVASSAVIAAGDETLLASGLTSEEYLTSGPETFRYWRLNVLEAGASYAGVKEIELLMNGVNQIAVMSSNVLPSPQVASASSVISASYEPFLAFDGITNAATNPWYSGTPGPHWLQLDMGTAIEADALRLTHMVGANIVDTVTSFELYGSATGSFSGEETLIVASRGDLISVEGQQFTFTF